MAGASLIFVRIFDVIALAFWALLFLPPLLNAKINTMLSGYFFVVLIIAGFFFYRISQNVQIRKKISRLLYATPPSCNNSSGILMRILALIRDTAKHFLTMTKEVPSSRIFLMSLVLWFLNFAYFYVVLLSFGQEVTFFQSILPAYGATLGHLLPINSIGSLGTFESGMVLGQVGLKIEGQVSVPVAFLTHAHVLATSALASMIGWFYLKEYN
jgi:uncharacterized protein (TIRG00374 family)